MGMGCTGASPGVRLSHMKSLLTSKGLSASALPVLRNQDGRRQFERFGVFLPLPPSPLGSVLGCQKPSAFLLPSGRTELGKRIACGLVQSERSWSVSAFCSQLPCAYSIMTWSRISLPCYPEKNQTLLRAERSTADKQMSYPFSRSQHPTSSPGQTFMLVSPTQQHFLHCSIPALLREAFR